jgi:exodeoxyribonuclease VII large subunit
VLARGFAVVKDAEGRIVKRAASVSSGNVLDIEFADGKVAAVASGGTVRPKPAPRGKPGSGQGSLF